MKNNHDFNNNYKEKMYIKIKLITKIINFFLKTHNERENDIL